MMKIDNPARIRQTRRVFDHRGEALPPRASVGSPLPRITIVTPSYNQAEYLEECIDSVLSQGYPNLEYIIMDGGSTDGSVDIIRKYESHLAHWQSGPDGGQYPAIEDGLNRGSGEIMAWLNSDDRYWPGALQTVADAFAAHPEVGWLTGRGTVIDGEGLITRIEHLKSLSRDEMLDPERRYFLQQESTFWRRDLWQRAGGRIDTGLKLAGDFELWLRFASHTDLHVVDAVLGSFRLHQGQKTDAGLEAYYAEAAQVVKRERKRLGLAPDIAALVTSRIELITSLVPRQDTYQRLAVRSWLKLGFAVTSINPADEHDYLRRAYPEVRLVAAPRDGRKAVGKACVYVDDILVYLKTSKADAFGIINADVYLEAEHSLVDFLCEEARGALVYGSRQEVEGLHSATGWTYWMGFDYFFFDRSLLDAFPKSDFMLGIPWWDYWVPFLLVQNGIPIKHLDSPIAYHVSHPVAYSTEQLISFGNHFAGLCPSSRSAILNRQHNRNLGLLGKGDYCYSVDLLAAFSRYEIYRASRHIRWQSPRLALLANGLVDVDAAEFLVTAIVSTYRSAAFIGECLSDLVGQTIADRLEIIVVDAASPENEGEIVAAFQQRHPNIRYIRTPERISVYAAWNLVAREARGRYLVSCSTNDRLVPHALAIMANALDERPEVAIAYGSSLLTRKPHQTSDNFDFAGVYIWPTFEFKKLLEQPGIGPHAMWRRRLHEEFGYFDESFAAIADQDFWLRVGRHYLLWNVHDFTGLYWVTEDSLSGKVVRAQAEYREINERHRLSYAYGSWLDTRHFTRSIGARYETRMAQWRYRPTFHVFVRHTEPGFDGLSRTIQSLSAQYYHDVRIVVLSPQPIPPGIGGERFGWITCAPADWRRAVDTAAPTGQADWLLLLQDGDIVEPRAFLELGEAIHTHPDWRLVFTDEDEYDPANPKESHTPHFKPGVNADWLCAVPYLGESVALAGAWLQTLGGLSGASADVEAYDATLRTFEISGAAGIGLVQDVLLHRPAGRHAVRPRQAHAEAVLAHLRRCGLAANVGPGIDGTIRIEYRHPANPAVAILVPFDGQLAQLERTVTSLIEKTSYPAFRVVVADCRTKADAAGDAFLAGLEALDSPAITVSRQPGGTTPAATVGRLLDTMSEDYFVIWQTGAAAVQPDWLTLLMAHGQREGVVAVGPRLVTADGLVASAGLELGVLGPAGTAYRGVRMEYAGDTACLVADRQVSALDSRCLLLNKAAVRQAGGLEEAMGELWALDLAMRLRATGALLWTAYSIVLVSEDLTNLEKADLGFVERKAPPDPDAAKFYRRWFEQIGHDPYRNDNWARNSRGRVPETVGALTYDPMPWAPVPKVFAHMADLDGCGHYRILKPLQALLAAGRTRGGLSLRPLSLPEMSYAMPDSWVFQRQLDPRLTAAMADCAEYSGAFKVYEIDDLITRVPPASPHFKEFTPEVLERFRKGVRLCDRLVVATEPLAEAFRSLAPETIVVPNYLPKDPWQDLKPSRPRGPRPRVGWAGSISHAGDLALMLEVVKATAQEADWILYGRCPSELRPYVREVHSWTPMEEYPARLANLALDLAIAPLEINAFNEAKSHLKLLEYGILGYPVVCTDIVPYQGAFPVTRVRNRAKDWIAAIREHLADLDETRRRGRALREHVLANWMLDDHLDDWLRAWTR